MSSIPSRNRAGLPLNKLENSSMDPLTSPDDLVSQLEDTQLTGMMEAKKMAMYSALNNPLVLQEIMKKLDALLDLTTCRLVAHQWHSLSSPILRRRDLTLVTIEYDQTAKCFCLSSQYDLTHPLIQLDKKANYQKRGQRRRPLKELNKLLANENSNFPCSHFIFKTRPSQGNLGEEDVQEFFKIFGQKIKTLELLNGIIPCSGQFEPLTPPLTPRQTFVQLLNDWAPNVTKLVIQYFDYDWTTQSTTVHFNVPNLTEFSWRGKEGLCYPDQFSLTQEFYDWSNPSQTALQILLGASNLRQIQKFRLADLDLVIKSEKIDTVKTLDLQSGQRLLFLAIDLLKFIEAGGQLTGLRCVLPNYRIHHSSELTFLMGAYQKLLKVSKDTLVTLNFGSLKFNKENNQLPCYSLTLPSCMPRVNRLTLGSAVYRSGRCLPVTIDSNTFPNLEILDASILGFYEAREKAAAKARWTSLTSGGPETEGRTVRVQSDQNRRKCPTSWDDYFPKSLDGRMGGCQNDLPSVQTLIIGANCGVKYMKKLFCLCPNFKNVIILCHSTAGLEIVSTVIAMWPHLESIKVILTDGHPTQFQEQNFDHLFGGGGMASQPMILGLRALKRLEICFEGPCAKALTVQSGGNPPISELSYQNSFSLMPSLKVVLQYDHNCLYAKGLSFMLQSIAPHVNLVHRHNVNNEPIGHHTHKLVVGAKCTFKIF